MPHLRSIPAVLALAALAALALAACGEEDAQLLPGETAQEITANLDAVQQLADEGDCVGAEGAVEQVGEQIDGLEEVDQKLKQALERGAGRLDEVIAECEEDEGEAVGPAEVPTDAEEEEEEPEREQGRQKGQRDREAGQQPERSPANPALPPQSNGQGEAKGREPEGGETPGGGEAEEPSGGISPGAAVEGSE